MPLFANILRIINGIMPRYLSIISLFETSSEKIKVKYLKICRVQYIVAIRTNIGEYIFQPCESNATTR